MSKRIWLAVLLMLAMIAAACGGGAGEGEEPRPITQQDAGEVTAVRQVTETPGVATDTPEPPAEPAATETLAPAQPSLTTDAEPTDTPTSTAVPTTAPTKTATPTATSTATPQPVVYTSDGNPCIRPLGVLSAFSAAGQAPLDVGVTDDLLLARLPRPYLVDVAFAPAVDGRLLVTNTQPFSSDEPALIQIADIDSGLEIARLPSTERIYSLVMSRDVPLLAAVNGAGEVWLWDVRHATPENGRLVTTLDHAALLALSPDGQLLAVSTTGGDGINSWGAAQLIDVATGQTLRLLEGEVVEDSANASGFGGRSIANGHANRINWLGFSPNGRALLTFSNLDRTLRLWDVESGEHLRCFDTTGFAPIKTVSFNDDGREFVTAGSRDLLIWDTSTSLVDRRFSLPPILAVEQETAVFGPDGDVILSTSRREQAAYIWDSEDGRLLGLMRHPLFVNGADISPDGGAVATIVREPLAAAAAEAWVWNANHPTITLAATAQNLVGEGLELGQEGDIDGMLAALAEAQNLSPEDDVLLRPAIWHLACQYGGYAGQATPELLAACDTAVEGFIAQESGFFSDAKMRDSRGVVRALAGDYAAAIEDFEAYVETLAFDPARSELRQSWIRSLRSGVNPFDEATLRALKNE